MQITNSGAIPIHVARAYGVNPARTPERVAPPSTTPGTDRADAPPAPKIDALVGARVPGGISFDGAAAAPTLPALPLYTRAADRIEAAVGIQLGRSIDLRG